MTGDFYYLSLRPAEQEKMRRGASVVGYEGLVERSRPGSEETRVA